MIIYHNLAKRWARTSNVGPADASVTHYTKEVLKKAYWLWAKGALLENDTEPGAKVSLWPPIFIIISLTNEVARLQLVKDQVWAFMGTESSHPHTKIIFQSRFPSPYHRVLPIPVGFPQDCPIPTGIPWRLQILSLKISHGALDKHADRFYQCWKSFLGYMLAMG